jgi:hypothetical protein
MQNLGIHSLANSTKLSDSEHVPVSPLVLQLPENK